MVSQSLLKAAQALRDEGYGDNYYLCGTGEIIQRPSTLPSSLQLTPAVVTLILVVVIGIGACVWETARLYQRRQKTSATSSGPTTPNEALPSKKHKAAPVIEHLSTHLIPEEEPLVPHSRDAEFSNCFSE
mgnify:CR=1 FL=1